MKLGISCNRLCRVEEAARYGFDYVEVALNWMQKLSLEERREFEKSLSVHKMPVYAFNAFFGSEVRLLGEGVNFAETERIARENVNFASAYGAKIVVIGSAGARAIPEGYTETDAAEALGAVVNLTADLCAEQGIAVCVEPLRRSETNYINTVLDGLKFAEELGNPNVGCLVDFFHFHENGEDLETIRALKGTLVHAHLARPNPDRLSPKAEDEPILRQWMASLAEIGYDKALTLECRWKNPDFDTVIAETVPLIPLMRG